MVPLPKDFIVYVGNSATKERNHICGPIRRKSNGIAKSSKAVEVSSLLGIYICIINYILAISMTQTCA